MAKRLAKRSTLKNDEEVRRLKGLDPEKKQCLGPCHRTLPRSTAYFSRSEKRADGYKTWCKECLQNRNQATLEKGVAQAMTKLDKDILKTVLEGKSGGSSLPHITQFMEAVVSHLGGHYGFAMYYAANLMAAPPGSQTRERMLNKLLTLVQEYSADEKVNKPIEAMTEEELAERIAAYEKLPRIHDVQAG